LSAGAGEKHPLPASIPDFAENLLNMADFPNLATITCNKEISRNSGEFVKNLYPFFAGDEDCLFG
jgi:hypothetical protein